MRILIVLLALMALPAAAQELGWGRYDNVRFGYSGEVPAGFSGYGESDNGDGQIFDDAGKAQVLSYWGANIVDEDFKAEVASRIGYAERDGWNIAYQAVTPRWASFSGVMGQRLFYTHMIELCDGLSYAAMTVQYSAAQAAEMKPKVERLAKGLHAEGC